MNVRDATKNDAEHLAYLINLAGEDLPMFLWSRMAGAGQKPLAFGALRAMREKGSFSYRNAKILEIDGSVAGMLLSYPLPDPYDTGELDDYPAVVRPLVELEATGFFPRWSGRRAVAVDGKKPLTRQRSFRCGW